ncbi:hypothetical protein COCOBI_16-1640 [Coccomyxa sp. Obi]|nr:hypothetical protein COCOBI_16-1640 [Coccomyxa sp. Obi]
MLSTGPTRTSVGVTAYVAVCHGLILLELRLGSLTLVSCHHAQALAGPPIEAFTDRLHSATWRHKSSYLSIVVPPQSDKLRSSAHHYILLSAAAHFTSEGVSSMVRSVAPI